jgi:very-short-patch-repair endonuclease
MEFFLIVLVVGIALAVSAGKKKPRNYYRKRPSPTWAAPEQKTAFPSPPSHPAAPAYPQSKIAPDGFRYDPEGEWPFIRKDLITETEKVLFNRLRQALPDYHVLTQVQLSQLVHVKKGHSFKMWWMSISRMSVDYVIIDKDMKTVAAIELDDKSHYSDEDRHKADAKKDKVLTAAGIRVIRWRCEIMPEIEQIALAFPEHRKPENVKANDQIEKDHQNLNLTLS